MNSDAAFIGRDRGHVKFLHLGSDHICGWEVILVSLAQPFDSSDFPLCSIVKPLCVVQLIATESIFQINCVQHCSSQSCPQSTWQWVQGWCKGCSASTALLVTACAWTSPYGWRLVLGQEETQSTFWDGLACKHSTALACPVELILMFLQTHFVCIYPVCLQKFYWCGWNKLLAAYTSVSWQ